MIKIMIKNITFILFIVLSFTIRANNAGEGYSNQMAGIRGHYGFIIPHTRAIKDIANTYPWGIELDYGWVLTGQNAWNYCFCYPKTGFSLAYFNFDNPDIIGSGVFTSAYIEPYIALEKSFNFSYRLGLGVVYLTRPYHPETNPVNLFYSTNISFVASFALSLSYRLNSKNYLKLTTNYNHTSNGGIHLPNKGINFPTLSLGYDHFLKKPVFPKREKIKKQLYDKKWWINTALFFTGKNKEKVESKLYPVFGATLTASRLFTRMNAVAGGIDIEVNRALRAKLDEEQINTDHKKAALLTGHNLLVGKFTFSQYLGIYLYAPRKPTDPVYQRYELVFSPARKFYTGISIKAHRHIADYMDVRAGIRF
jgi:hypothetical protein